MPSLARPPALLPCLTTDDLFLDGLVDFKTVWSRCPTKRSVSQSIDQPIRLPSVPARPGSLQGSWERGRATGGDKSEADTTGESDEPECATEGWPGLSVRVVALTWMEFDRGIVALQERRLNPGKFEGCQQE